MHVGLGVGLLLSGRSALSGLEKDSMVGYVDASAGYRGDCDALSFRSLSSMPLAFCRECFELRHGRAHHPEDGEVLQASVELP